MMSVRNFAVPAAVVALLLCGAPVANAGKTGDIAANELSAQGHHKGKAKGGGVKPGRAAPHANRAVIHRGGPAVVRRGQVRGPAARAVIRSGPGPRLAVRAPVRYWHGWRRPARIAIYRGPWRFWYNNGWRTLVPIAALGVFAVGAATYYADGYVSIPQPICTGPTADGCQLRWQDVPMEEGGTAFQCVQYCAQRNRTVGEVKLPAEPPGAQSQAQAPAQRNGCELTIYSEAEFKGTSAPTEEDQSDLSGDGWKDQIASVQVKSGTWDFFTSGEFDGEMMRLTPGRYPGLDAKWSRHIGSFMCSAPAGS